MIFVRCFIKPIKERAFMNSYDIIVKKKRGERLSEEEIQWIVTSYIDGTIPDYQMSALLMAICFNSMDDRETAALTLSMMNSGDKYSPSADLNGFCVDKHSTGGVGDKTTLIVAPICAACGVYVPKMSGRGLGHTGGTIDKLEAIPGFRTDITRERFIQTVKESGFSISAQTGNLVPADKKIYALRNATATVDSIPLISSSIMSKKLATGADAIVLDVKCGDGAFMKDLESARKLADSMISAAKLLGRKCSAVITDMQKPLGYAVGNSVEVAEAIDALKGHWRDDLRDVCLTLACEMLKLAGKGSADECMAMAEKAVTDGSATAALRKMITMQGGDPAVLDDISLLGVPKEKREVFSSSEGYITGISCEATGILSMHLGAGRLTKESIIDRTAGILFNKGVGDHVRKGELLGTLFTSTTCDMDKAAAEMEALFTFSDTRPDPAPSVIEILR